MLRDSRILITGATGFLGRHLHRLLTERGYEDVVGVGGTPGKPGFRGRPLPVVDLCDGDDVESLFDTGAYEYVFHLAGYNGGIGLNAREPARIFALNTAMGLHVIEACRTHGVKKVVSVVASCAYPHMEWHQGCEAETMYEERLQDGPPHESVVGHAYAKRNLQVMSRLYHKQFGLNAVCACPTTLYGPGDSYDPERTKVMGGMVKRFVDAARAGEQEVSCWGSGAPLREFLYVTDAAALLVETMLKYENPTRPLNLGTGQEVSIRGLAELVASVVQYKGRIVFDRSKPDGQMRKRLDTTTMKSLFPDFKPVPLRDGVVNAVADYWHRTGFLAQGVVA